MRCANGDESSHLGPSGTQAEKGNAKTIKTLIPAGQPLEIGGGFVDNTIGMIDRGSNERQGPARLLGSESVHGLPLDWSEPKRASKRSRSERLRQLLATQNVHGLPTSWDEVHLSE